MMCVGENISTIHTDAHMKILQGFWGRLLQTMRWQIWGDLILVWLSAKVIFKTSACVWNQRTARADDGLKWKHWNQNDSEVCEDFILVSVIRWTQAETLSK